MSIRFKVPCQDNVVHNVLVSLELAQVRIEMHDEGLVHRYKAMCVLGGEPLPCIAVAMVFEDGINPGHLILPPNEIRFGTIEHRPYPVLRDFIDLCITDVQREDNDNWVRLHCGEVPLVVTPGDHNPKPVGAAGYHRANTVRGQIITNVAAYEAKGGKTTYVPSTYRYLVGEEWLKRHCRGLITDCDFPAVAVDPDWETATGDHHECTR